MNSLYKFINENQIEPYKGGFVVLDNRIYTNPTDETLHQAGYKTLICAETPEYDEEKQFLVEIYSEEEDSIYCNYIVKDFEEIQHEEEDSEILEEEVAE